MPEGRDTIIEVSNIMSFVLYTQILKQSVLKPASPGITLSCLMRVLLKEALSVLRVLKCESQDEGDTDSLTSFSLSLLLSSSIICQ